MSAPVTRSRRRSRPSGDERQAAILTAAEQLLGERGFADLSIDDLARGAGLSRPGFYFYFASKDAVLLALLDRVAEQALQASTAAMDHLADDPPACWREAITGTVETFRAHRPVMLACVQAATTNPAVRELWATVMEGWVRATATAIDSERRRGAAPPGVPARDLAIALNSMNERALYLMFAGESPALDESTAIDVLLNVWLSAIYTPSPS